MSTVLKTWIQVAFQVRHLLPLTLLSYLNLALPFHCVQNVCGFCLCYSINQECTFTFSVPKHTHSPVTSRVLLTRTIRSALLSVFRISLIFTFHLALATLDVCLNFNTSYYHLMCIYITYVQLNSKLFQGRLVGTLVVPLSTVPFKQQALKVCSSDTFSNTDLTHNSILLYSTPSVECLPYVHDLTRSISSSVLAVPPRVLVNSKQ